MIPKKFEDANGVCKKQGCGDLPVLSTKDGFKVSCWTMTEEEKKKFEKTGEIWLSVYGGQPAVCLSVEKPYKMFEDK